MILLALLLTQSADVLLITDKELAPAWQGFADWKTRLGRRTKILTVQEIDAGYEGADIQQKIRAAVLAHIDDAGTRFVILGGDAGARGKGLVPDRDTVHATMGYKDIPTDLYYISPKDWDADDDGVYGDWETDRDEIAYTHPKGVSIGRIPVRTAEDVAAYTAKVIAYESKYPEREFATILVYTNTVDASEPKVRRSWDNYVSKAWPQGSARRFFHTGDEPLTPANWATLVNKRGTSKMHMHGHGFLPGWVLEEGLVDAGVVGTLVNENAYLVMTTVSCFTGQYENRKDPSIAEAMLRAPGAGAVAIVAPSREGVPIFHNPSEDMKLMVTEGKLDGTTQHHTAFWSEGLGKNLTVGEAYMAAKAALTDDAKKTAGYHWCLCELTLLGDPTLDLRARDPVTPEIGAPKSIETGKQKFAVTAPDGLTVCLWKGDEVYAVGKAGEFEIAPATAGTLRVTVSGPNANAVTVEVEVR